MNGPPVQHDIPRNRTISDLSRCMSVRRRAIETRVVHQQQGDLIATWAFNTCLLILKLDNKQVAVEDTQGQRRYHMTVAPKPELLRPWLDRLDSTELAGNSPAKRRKKCPARPHSTEIRIPSAATGGFLEGGMEPRE